MPVGGSWGFLLTVGGAGADVRTRNSLDRGRGYRAWMAEGSPGDAVEGSPEPSMALVWTLKVVPFAVIAAVVVAVGLSVVGVATSTPSPGDPGFGAGPPIRWDLAVVLALLYVAIAGLGAALYRRNYRWEVGTDDVRVRRGLVSRHQARVPYDRVQNVNLSQSALMRPFGLWKVALETAGSAGPQAKPEGVLAGVDDPDRWEALVRERIDEAGGDGV